MNRSDANISGSVTGDKSTASSAGGHNNAEHLVTRGGPNHPPSYLLIVDDDIEEQQQQQVPDYNGASNNSNNNSSSNNNGIMYRSNERSLPSQHTHDIISGTATTTITPTSPARTVTPPPFMTEADKIIVDLFFSTYPATTTTTAVENNQALPTPPSNNLLQEQNYNNNNNNNDNNNNNSNNSIGNLNFDDNDQGIDIMGITENWSDLSGDELVAVEITEMDSDINSISISNNSCSSSSMIDDESLEEEEEEKEEEEDRRHSQIRCYIKGCPHDADRLRHDIPLPTCKHHQTPKPTTSKGDVNVECTVCRGLNNSSSISPEYVHSRVCTNCAGFLNHLYEIVQRDIAPATNGNSMANVVFKRRKLIIEAIDNLKRGRKDGGTTRQSEKKRASQRQLDAATNKRSRQQQQQLQPIDRRIPLPRPPPDAASSANNNNNEAEVEGDAYDDDDSSLSDADLENLEVPDNIIYILVKKVCNDKQRLQNKIDELLVKHTADLAAKDMEIQSLHRKNKELTAEIRRLKSSASSSSSLSSS